MTSSSSQNWASMIMGAGPEQHGITSNEWERDRFSISPTVAGPEEDSPEGTRWPWVGYGRRFRIEWEADAENAMNPGGEQQG